MVVDLGCGFDKRGDLGIDRVPLPGVDLVCQLGFEPIPLESGSADEVVSYDFLEHLPGPVPYMAEGHWKFHNPRIFLLREVHRILKPGGTFFSHTPAFPHVQWAQDPTHATPPWTDRSWDYFCTTAPQLEPVYGIDFTFEMVSLEYNGPYLDVLLRKPASK